MLCAAQGKEKTR